MKELLAASKMTPTQHKQEVLKLAQSEQRRQEKERRKKEQSLKKAAKKLDQPKPKPVEKKATSEKKMDRS